MSHLLFRIADFNGDGLDDLICKNQMNDISFAINDFTRKTLFKNPNPFYSYCPYGQIKIGNFDDDPSMEMLCSGRGKFIVYVLIFL